MKETIKNIKISQIFLTMIISCFAFSFIANIVDTLSDLKYNIYGFRYVLTKKINSEDSLNINSIQKFFTMMTKDFGKDLNKSQSYLLVKTLTELDKMPLSEKRKTLLFIPQNNNLYWKLNGAKIHYDNKGHTKCQAIPFLAPAITGIAMLDGMPPVECETFAYGYQLYQKREGEQQLSVNNPQQLCASAMAKGFSQVIVLDEKDGNLITKTYHCNDYK